MLNSLFLDSSSTVSGYVASVSPVKLSKPKRKNQHQPKQYFDFYLHSEDEVRRGVCFSPQKYNLLGEISKSGDENQGLILTKIKLNDESNDFILTDCTTITRSNLVYQKLQMY